VSPAGIEKLTRTQSRALARAADLLAPGGYLLYATCSLEAEENERVVEEVLAGQPDLSPAAIEAPEALAPFVAGARFRLLPDERTDGFTAHLLRRKAEDG
jgi:16S rRNA (cytosine967-C5)-methyltransferase